MSRYTSTHGYYVRSRHEELGGNKPLDTGAVHAVINNLDHLQDECLQTTANLVHPTSALSSDGRSDWIIENASTEIYNRFPIPPIPVFLRWNPDGSSTRVHVTIWGAANGGSQKFHVGLSPLGSSRSAPDSTWGTQFDYEDASNPYLFDLYVERLSEAMWRSRAIPGVSGAGVFNSTTILMGQIDVWGKTVPGFDANLPTIEAIAVRGWVGA